LPEQFLARNIAARECYILVILLAGNVANQKVSHKKHDISTRLARKTRNSWGGEMII